MSVLTRNNVKISGMGHTIMLFAHGFGCDQHMWRAVAPAFENDYRVVLSDHVGAGQSDLSAYDPAKYRTFDGYAHELSRSATCSMCGAAYSSGTRCLP